MSAADRELQERAELAEDVIGAYIGKLGARLQGLPLPDPRRPRVSLLSIWLEREVRAAGQDRAHLFEYSEDASGLEGLIQLYQTKLATLETASARPLGGDPFLRARLDEARQSPA